ncbi:MAG: hypothetical protein V1834_02810 [Candidatus Micrarchaeota archaeon]
MKAKIVFSEEAKEVFDYLTREAPKSKIERSILKAVENKTRLISQNTHYGQAIAKKLIPIEYIQKYDVTNLFRVELPNFWRMLYTVTESENRIEVIAFVLDLIDHDKYDKKFGYAKR